MKQRQTPNGSHPIRDPTCPDGRGEIKTSSRSLTMTIAQSLFSAVIILTFISTAICLHIQQWLGTPLYYLSSRWYYAWQAVVKESTALLLIGLNQLRAPTKARISGDSSVKGQIIGGEKLDFKFPDRMVMIANHQIYTDWIFFWWTAYTAGQHGHFFVILKDSLRKIPVIGSGLTFFSWIFLSRRWDADKVNFEEGISRLSDFRTKDPMWLLIFPEGTNMSRNARAASQKWAEKSGTPARKHVLLPRTRGLQCCLQGLADTVDWVYDCTIVYDDIPTGQYGQEIHSLKALYIYGRGAPQAHMHWRRFAIKDIPYDNSKAFEEWVLQRWIEKDELLDQFYQQGCFPAEDGFTTSEIKIRNPLEAAQILGGVIAAAASWWICKTMYSNVGRILFADR